jgi:hypothetical protein
VSMSELDPFKAASRDEAPRGAGQLSRLLGTTSTKPIGLVAARLGPRSGKRPLDGIARDSQ